jgi:hypothetical protein
MLLLACLVSEHEQQQPSPGDVIVTREGASFAITIAPERHQLNMARLDDAILIAMKWAKDRSVRAWHLTDGSGFRLID